MEIEAKYAPTPAYVPRISTGSFVTGDANLEFVRRTEGELLELLDGQAGAPPNKQLEPEERKLTSVRASDGDFIGQGKLAGDPFAVLVGMEDQVRQTLATMQVAGDSVAQASNNVSRLADNVGQAIGDGGTQVKDLTQQTELAARELQATLADIRVIVGDRAVQEALKQSVLRLPLLEDKADATLEEFQQVATNLAGVGEAAEDLFREAEKTAENLDQITRPFANRSEALAESFASNLTNLDYTLREVGVFSRRLNEGDGTLRRIIEDDELYWQIKRVVDNVEGATTRIRPILDDVRVISDKLARDPRQLGLKGALDKRPSGMGLK